MPEAVESLRLKSLTLPHRLVLAPMCGITLMPFRRVCKEYGAGLVFNQMVSAKALTMRDKKSLKLMEFAESERPFGQQLFGNDAAVLAEAARIAQDFGPDVVDLNLGCPAKKIVNDGGGSALLQDEVKLAGILRAMRSALKIPFTVKMRAGWDDKSKNALAVAKIAEAEGADAVAIHARTRSQGYSGKSDWEFIAHLKRSLRIPVIGNGDVETAEDARRMMRETSCDAVMTGRGAFETPWIFRDFTEASPREPSTREKLDLVMRQYAYAMEYHGREGGIKMMRKHLCSYTRGLRGGAEFRNAVVRLSDWDELRGLLASFFTAGAAAEHPA